MPPNSSPEPSSVALDVPVRAPYRLDLTANVLRRLSTNVVDVYTGGAYVRAVAAAGALPAILEVRQPSPERLAVRVHGAAGAVDWDAYVRRSFGVDVDLHPFYRAAKHVGWLDAIVRRMQGVRPPRYSSLWEAVVNAVVFQQVSIHAAAAILGRVILHHAQPVTHGMLSLYPFPAPARFITTDGEQLRGLGLSRHKVTALLGLAARLEAGALCERELEPLPTPALVERLATERGIGPWTAAVIALRGFGRLDIFPLNDSGVARSLATLTGGGEVDVPALLETLGAQRGMLYYHLLLGRLEASGQLA